MPKHKNFGFQRGARPEQPNQGAPDQPAKIAPSMELSTNSRGTVSCFWFCGRDRHGQRTTRPFLVLWENDVCVCFPVVQTTGCGVSTNHCQIHWRRHQPSTTISSNSCQRLDTAIRAEKPIARDAAMPAPWIQDLRNDIVGGLIVSSAIAIPLALGFGMFAFVTMGDQYFPHGAVAGLISAFVAGTVCLLLGDRSVIITTRASRPHSSSVYCSPRWYIRPSRICNRRQLRSDWWYCSRSSCLLDYFKRCLGFSGSERSSSSRLIL